MEQAKLDEAAQRLLRILAKNPYQSPPEFKKLQGNLKDSFSRRINKQHRIVYDILPNDEGLSDENGDAYDGIVKIIRMWTHYEL